MERIVIVRRTADRTLDMNLDGSFNEPPATPLATRIFRAALVVAALGAALGLAALMFWFALITIPLVIAAGTIAWLSYRYQRWRNRGRWG